MYYYYYEKYRKVYEMYRNTMKSIWKNDEDDEEEKKYKLSTAISDPSVLTGKLIVFSPSNHLSALTGHLLHNSFRSECGQTSVQQNNIKL